MCACACTGACVGESRVVAAGCFAPLILINPSNNPPDFGCPVFVGGLMGEEGESEEGEGGVNPSHPTPLTPSFKMGETLQRAKAKDDNDFLPFFSSSYYDHECYLHLFIWPVTKRG